jgi:hypothetical protein
VAASPPGPGCPPRGARRSPCGAGRSVATAAARGSRAGRPCSSGRRRCARSSSQPAVVIESRNHGASITTPRATPPNGFSFTPPRQTLRLPGPLAPMVPWHGPASGAQVWTHYTVIFTASCSAATHISNRWCHSGLRLLYTVLVVRTAQQQHRPTGSTSPPTHPPGARGVEKRQLSSSSSLAINRHPPIPASSTLQYGSEVAACPNQGASAALRLRARSTRSTTDQWKRESRCRRGRRESWGE